MLIVIEIGVVFLGGVGGGRGARASYNTEEKDICVGWKVTVVCEGGIVNQIHRCMGCFIFLV